MNTKPLGFSGENYAANLLLKLGYNIIERNFKAKFGEIDLIALKGNALVFVEVKTRTSTKFGLPEEAVTPYKIRKIARVGELYSNMNKILPKKQIIVVVSLLIENNKVIREKIIKVT